jgi:hypothetical protein
MAALLGAPGVLAVEAGGVEVALRERVSEPDRPVHVTLSFPQAMAEVEGELRLARAQLDPDGEVTGFVPFGDSRPIRYEGLGAETLGLTLVAPKYRGIYKVSYHRQGEAEPSGQDELFVQEPSG